MQRENPRSQAHEVLASAGDPHPVAGFAEIMGQRRDESELAAGLLDSIDVDRLFDEAKAEPKDGAEPTADFQDSDEFKLDAVRSAGRWCVFWAERGDMLGAYW